ncbi:MAG: Zn-ribbon domain-containing OB-fold protein [Streptosporangiaceae bacterium]
MTAEPMPAEFTPEPAVTELTRPFWEGGLAGELRLQRCRACGHLRYPVSGVCPRCLSGEARWEAVSGLGTVQSYTVFERTYNEAWQHQVPYAVALVELDEGPVFLTNLVGVPVAQLRVGQRVSAVFERRSAQAALPQFTPVQQAGPR